MAEEPSCFGGDDDFAPSASTLVRSAAAAFLVWQRKISAITPVWFEVFSNASCAPSGHDFTPVLALVLTFSATAVKPAVLAYEVVMRSLASDFAEGVLAPAVILAESGEHNDKGEGHGGQGTSRHGHGILQFGSGTGARARERAKRDRMGR